MRAKAEGHSEKPGRNGARKLRLYLQLAGAALALERFWPALWPAVALLGLFLVLALFDLPSLLPVWLHWLLLAMLGAGLMVALARGWHALRLPREAERRRRLETASGLTHRPLTALADTLGAGAQDPASTHLFEVHRARMQALAAGLRVGPPAAGLVRRDPYALRVALALLLVLGAIDAGGDWPQRIARALDPGIRGFGAVAEASLDLWVTPPQYTGLAPQFLGPASAGQTIAVAAGSTVLAQVHGGSGLPRLTLEGAAASDFTAIDPHNFKATSTVNGGHRLTVAQDGRVLGTWPLTVVADQPPSIAFPRPPQGTDHAALRLDYQARDDYGVEGVNAIIRHKAKDGSNADAIHLELPLPGLHLKEAHEASFHDLSAHPWAGTEVEIELQAVDAIGQTGASERVTMKLPERVFHDKIARAIVDARKELTLDPANSNIVSETLSDLSLRPALFRDDIVVFLALRTAQARLTLDHSAQAIPEVQALLWNTALRLEEGRSSLAQEDLRQAMQALKDALARNAPDAEIERLTREVQAAMDRYLQSLAENLERQNQDQASPMDPSRMLSPQDLKRMLDRARDLARTGARDSAQNLLSQLQEMLENLKMGRGADQGQAGQGQAMRQMQDLMQRQQQLLDKSFRQSRQSRQGMRGQGQQGKGQQGQGQQGQGQQGQGQMGEGQEGQGQQGQGEAEGEGGDAGRQEALRRELGDLMGRLGEQSADLPNSLGQADRAMRGAVDALRRHDPGQAVGPQTEALDALQQAARSLAEQMAGQNGSQPGDEPGGKRGNDRDPFGRLTDQEGGNGGIYEGGRMRMGPKGDDAGIDKAKEILDELRHRAGERSRPELERDYLDRLLKQF
ncbi:MAG TPA: TIGR02302 family protein [Stellaceae bacterium]|nr:TIGR02302 family protein [Stellaceae bacterium]